MRIHLFTLLICLHGCLLMQAQGLSNNEVFDKTVLVCKKCDTKLAHLQYLEDALQLKFAYSNFHLDLKQKVNADLPEQLTVGHYIASIINDPNYHFKISETNILLIPKQSDHHKSSLYTISGFIKDDLTQEVLIGASIYAPGLQQFTQTNPYGFYSIQLPEGYHELIIHKLGYKADTLHLYLDKQLRIDQYLQSRTLLSDIEIKDEKVRNLQQSEIIKYDEKDVIKSPFPIGYGDVMRLIQNQPGFQTGLDGTTTMRVRGSDPGQNLYMIDDVPVYYVDHLFGSASIFNTLAIKDATIYKGDFPARYSGRVASVLDIHTKDGNMSDYNGSLNLGLIKGTINLEGPIVKDKSSAFISYRRTWIDQLFKLVQDDYSFNFHDFNAKVNYILNKNNRLFLSYYQGLDKFSSDTSKSSHTAWGNRLAALKWNAVVTPKLFFTSIASLSGFKYTYTDQLTRIREQQVETIGSYNGQSSITEYSWRNHFNWQLWDELHFNFGMNYAYSQFIPAAVKSNISEINVPINKFDINEIGIYYENVIKLNKRLKWVAGLHFNHWFNHTLNYQALQPRSSLQYQYNNHHQWHLNVSYLSQFVHLINSNSYGMPTDFWVPSTQKINPERNLQISTGYDGRSNMWQYNVNFFWKYMDHVTAYNYGKDLFDNSIYWENKIIQGTGLAYGTELAVQKQFRKINLHALYTLSWNWRQFDELNNGKQFAHRYDRRHNFKIILDYKWRKHLFYTASWMYLSGEAFTLPDQLYGDLDQNLGIDPTGSGYSNQYTYNITTLNNFRLPAIHRLDLAVVWRKPLNRRWTQELNAGITNAYGHRNVWFTNLEYDEIKSRFVLKGYSIIQCLPFISYTIQF